MSERSTARSPSALPAPSPHPTPIPVPPAPLLSVYNASPKIEPDELLERCQMGGGIPVMGFGWRVVCLKPASAEWWSDPRLPDSVGKKP